MFMGMLSATRPYGLSKMQNKTEVWQVVLTAVNIVNELKPSASILYRLALTSNQLFCFFLTHTCQHSQRRTKEGGGIGEKKNETTGRRNTRQKQNAEYSPEAKHDLRHYLIFFLILSIYFWLCCIFIALCGLSLVVATRGYSSLWYTDFSLWWLLLLRSTLQGVRASVVAALGPQSPGSVVVAHEFSCSLTCGIFLDQGLNPCPLHWQVDSYPLRHQGSLVIIC